VARPAEGLRDLGLDNVDEDHRYELDKVAAGIHALGGAMSRPGFSLLGVLLVVDEMLHS
jgi:hypothetical protein